MQIFEITQHQLVNEKFGFSAVGPGATASSVLGGIAKYAGNQIGKSLGMQDNSRVSGVAAQNAATAATAGVVKQQAAQQQQLWNNTLQTMSKAASGIGQTQIDPKALATNFMKQLQGMLKPHGLTATMDQQNGIPVPQVDDYENQIDPEMLDQKTKAQIDQTIQQIDQAIYAILTAPATAKPTDLTNAWMSLAQGIANAGSMTAFHQGQSTGSAARTPGISASESDPKTRAALAAMGTDAAGLAGLNTLIQRSGGFKGKATGDPTIDGLLKSAKILK
jgi:hypothetical protein